jgi:transmembrane sensor
LSAAELDRLVAWRTGALYFENRPLSDVVDELGRYTPLTLVIDDEKLRELPVGGSFQANAQGAESLLVMLQQGFGLNVRREGGRAYIEQRR